MFSRTCTTEGSSSLLLNVTSLDGIEPGLATMQVEVAKAGVGPDAAIDQRFTLHSEWSCR